MISTQDNLIVALPKGRVLEDCLPLIQTSRFKLVDDPKEIRKILLASAMPELKVLVITGWAVSTYVT